MTSAFGINIIPDNDVERVKAVNRYCIFNTPAEPAFNSIVELAKTIFKTPIAHISYMSDDEEFIKASVGLGDMQRVGRGESICALTILNSELTVIEDAAIEPLLANHPYVLGEFGLRFYAGAPLVSSDGYTIGTICLVDKHPRTFTDNDRDILLGLAKVAMEQTEMRLKTLQEAEKQSATNDKLSASEQRLQSILDTMAEGVFITNLQGQITYSNSVAQRILGFKENELKERTFDDERWENLRVDGSALPRDEHPMAVAINRNDAVYDQEIAVKSPKGDRIYLSINAAPIHDPQTGRLTSVIGTFMDVTSRRKLLQQKEEFIGISSHELKTPVTSLKASLQMLERMKDDLTLERMNKLVAQSNKSLNKLSSLIGDMQDASRLSQGNWQLQKTTFTISDILSNCCQSVRAAKTHQIVLQGDLQVTLYADRRQINQVIENLVSNVVRHAPESKKIVINVSQSKEAVKIAVTDKGPGIPPDKLPHLFERYYRAEYIGVQFSGLGLGLFISKEIIQKHGGQIGVDTELGQGSTFWFTLPLTSSNFSAI